MENFPYTFISYAHADEAKTSALIRGMKAASIRLWFDEGIEAGSEWPEFIARKVMHCDRFVLFLSNAYLNSQNCKRELNFAISKKKEILSVYLEDVELSLGMEMQLGTYQAVFLNRFDSMDEFLASFCKEPFFRNCRITQGDESTQEVTKALQKEELPFTKVGDSCSEKLSFCAQEEGSPAACVQAVNTAIRACNEHLTRSSHAFNFRFPDALSKKQKENAVRVIAKGKVTWEQVIAVMDDTLFKSGKSGYLVTEDRFFCAGMMLDTFEISLKDLVKVSTCSKSYLLFEFKDGSQKNLFFNNYYESFLVFFKTYLAER